MTRLLLGRLLLAIPTALGITLVTFFVVSLAGDPRSEGGLGVATSRSDADEERLARLLRTDLPWFLNVAPRDHQRAASEAFATQVRFWDGLAARIAAQVTEGARARSVTEAVVAAVVAAPATPPEEAVGVGLGEELDAEERARLGPLRREILSHWRALAALVRRGAWAFPHVPDLGGMTGPTPRILLAAASAAARRPLDDAAALGTWIAGLPGAASLRRAVEEWEAAVTAASTPAQRVDAGAALAPLGGLAAPWLVRRLETAEGAVLVHGLAWLDRHAGLSAAAGLQRLAARPVAADGARDRRLREGLRDLWERRRLEHRDVGGVFDRAGLLLKETRYARWLGRVARFDFGESLRYERPVAALIRERLPLTLGLGALALLLLHLVSIPVGVWAGLRPKSEGVVVTDFVLATLHALPTFVLGAVVVASLGRVVPIYGLRTPEITDALAHGTRSWWEPGVLADLVAHLALPVLLLASGGFYALARHARAGVLETARADFVLAARARGLSPKTVLLRHVLRVALLPLVSLFGLMLPTLVAGSVIIESLFDLRGLGRLAVEAAVGRDIPVTMGLVTLAALATWAGHLVADLGLAWLDPRSRDR